MPGSDRRLAWTLHADRRTLVVAALVVVLGARRAPRSRRSCGTSRGAIAGVAIGRKIWEQGWPARVVAAIAAIVHGGATAEQALRKLQVGV